MPRDPAAYLWDAHQALLKIIAFTRDQTWEDYQNSEITQSAVERQFEIIGEALNGFSKFDPLRAKEIVELQQIVSFRNLLIHGYATVDSEIVWRTVNANVPNLVEQLALMLRND